MKKFITLKPDHCHFIQDKLEISLIQTSSMVGFIIMYSHVVWNSVDPDLQRPADLDLHCLSQ